MAKSLKPSPGTPRELPWMRCGLVALAAFLLYMPAVAYDFTFDDGVIVARNPAVQEPGQWRRIFLSDYWPGASSALYRPITILSFAIERRIHGPDASGFHWTNVLLNAGVSGLFFLIAWHVLGPGWPAFLAGLLFATHPLHSEAVCGVVGRAELLSSLLALGALWIWLRRAAAASAWSVAPAWLLFLLALGAKENVIVLPALIAAWELALRRDPSKPAGLLRLLRTPQYLGFVVAAVLFLSIRTLALGGIAASTSPEPPFVENPLAHEPAGVRVPSALANQARGLGLHFFPRPLIADYSYRTLPARASWRSPAVLLVLALPLAAAFLWTRSTRHARLVSFGLVWYLVSILPAGNIIFAIGTIFGERLYYFPSAGLFLALGAAMAWSAGSLEARGLVAAESGSRALAAVTVMAAGVCCLITFLRIPVWSNDLALFTETTQQAPDNVKARLWFGDALMRAGRPAEALEQYRNALETYPDYPAAAMNVVVPLNTMKRYSEAIEAGERARRITGGGNAVLLYNLGLAYLGAGDSIRFLDCMTRVIRIDPSNGRAHAQLGRYYLQYAGDSGQARVHFQEALRLEPDMPDAAAVRNLLRRIR